MLDDDAPAEPAQRLVARVVDTLVVGLPVALVMRSELLGLPRATADLLTVPILAGLLLVYEAVQLALWGRTLGKRFAGLRVRGEPDGAGPGLGTGRALLRSAVYAVPIALRPVPVLGVLAGLFWVANAALVLEGTRRQALHDRLAGTVVVAVPHARRSPESGG
ncbi:RDD family protein [Thermomonospora amylolytica]|uniref:RDD family protein n=1 Tax=Thermomonospora amylolytica TaxID=1411117 RepID=UPI000E6CC889|nr:RDD family protein [Thermomonospora amylolytica]